MARRNARDLRPGASTCRACLLLTSAVACLVWGVTLAACTQAGAPAPCRAATTQPFAASSIWNTPIGSKAQYVHAGLYGDGLPLPANFHNDQEFFVAATASDPAVPWVNQGWWGPKNHCTVVQPTPATTIPLPASFTTASDGGWSPAWQSNNNPMGVLLPDGRTLVQMQPAYRCNTRPGAPLLAKWGNATDGCPQLFPNVTDVYGDGALGAHGGSGLSAVGGSIRLGELLPGSPPIAHALKLEAHAATYYYGLTRLQSATSSNGGRTQYLWPATGSDAGSETVPGGLYGGTNPHVAPGALLALPPSVAATINTTTAPGAAIKQALTDFGGYIVDDTADNSGSVCMQAAVNDEMRRSFGYSMTYPAGVSASSTDGGAALYRDLLAIFRGLHAVVNNGPQSVGGGGTPLVQPPPPLCPPTPRRRW